MEEKTEFKSEIKNCIFIPRFKADKEIIITAINSGESLPSENIFYFPNGYPGLAQITLNEYLICALEKCDVKTISGVIPEFMRTSLFIVLKYWLKAWIKRKR